MREREREREREWEWVCISICTGIDEKTTREVKKLNNSKMFMEEGQITKKIRKGSIWEREREKRERESGSEYVLVYVQGSMRKPLVKWRN